jgi:hypothetical protein
MGLDLEVDTPYALKEASDFSSESLMNLIGELKEKGISSGNLSRHASHWGLGSCSYGNFCSLYPSLGMVVGTLVGIGASFLCGEVCDRCYATEENRVIAEGISFLFPATFFTSSGFCVRKSQDYEFYHKIKEFYKDRLTS